MFSLSQALEIWSPYVSLTPSSVTCLKLSLLLISVKYFRNWHLIFTPNDKFLSNCYHKLWRIKDIIRSINRSINKSKCGVSEKGEELLLSAQQVLLPSLPFFNDDDNFIHLQTVRQ